MKQDQLLEDRSTQKRETCETCHLVKSSSEDELKKDRKFLRRRIKDAILQTPLCPDTNGPIACASCLSESIVDSLFEMLNNHENHGPAQ